MAEGLKREDSEDPFADLLAPSYEASPGLRRQLDGAGVAMGDESAQGELGVLSSAAVEAGRDVEPPGGPGHRAADAADLLTLKAFRGFLPPEVFRQVAGLTGAMIAQRHAASNLSPLIEPSTAPPCTPHTLRAGPGRFKQPTSPNISMCFSTPSRRCSSSL